MKLRRGLAWLLVACCAGLLSIALASRWLELTIVHRRGDDLHNVIVRAGTVTLGEFVVSGPTPYSFKIGSLVDPVQGWNLSTNCVPTAEWSFTPRWSDRSGSHALSRYMIVPLYIPLTLLALPTAWLFYRDRRSVRWSREGRCVGCGYDLSGVSGKCPECGREAA